MLKERMAVVRKAMLLFDGFIVSLAFFLAHFLRQHFHVFYKLDLIPSTQVIARTTASISDYLVVLFFVVPRLRLNYMENAIDACETEGVKATISVDLFDLKIAKLHQTELGDIPLLTFETTVAKEWQLFVKRAMDIVISGLGMILMSPLFFVVAVIIKLTSSGPVLFKQKRIGLNGRKFSFYKFRTMYKGAEKKLSELEAQNEMSGPIFKMKKDPRITPFGKILRKFSFDELPQLFNVFFGHMSLIGPRPPIPEEVVQYESLQRSDRNKINFNEWMKLDL